ncbi:MAG: hypothetical protein NT091_04855 [Candidatus Falkowbacteria bacterium]|nr:hypothetical protein [Candidatus Falkowbacteria bacterium]
MNQESLPFNNALSSYEAWDILSRQINGDVGKRYGFLFEPYSASNMALQLLRVKYYFYQKLLAGDKQLIAEYGAQIGKKNLQKRLNLAIENCISLGQDQDIRTQMKKVMDGFVLELIRRESLRLSKIQDAERESRNRIEEESDIADTEIDAVKIRHKKALRAAIHYINLVAVDHFDRVHQTASECQRIGICMCVGKEPPYLNHCIPDASALTLNKKR